MCRFLKMGFLNTVYKIEMKSHYRKILYKTVATIRKKILDLFSDIVG